MMLSSSYFAVVFGSPTSQARPVVHFILSRFAPGRPCDAALLDLNMHVMLPGRERIAKQYEQLFSMSAFFRCAPPMQHCSGAALHCIGSS
jgi:hypothetical protein